MVSILVFEGSARNGCAKIEENLAGSLKAGKDWASCLLLKTEKRGKGFWG